MGIDTGDFPYSEIKDVEQSTPSSIIEILPATSNGTDFPTASFTVPINEQWHILSFGYITDDETIYLNLIIEINGIESYVFSQYMGYGGITTASAVLPFPFPVPPSAIVTISGETINPSNNDIRIIIKKTTI